MTRARNARAFGLLCACCRPPADATRDDLVRRRAEDVDWSLFAALAQRHRVEGIVWEALSRARAALPPPIEERLRGRAAAIARQGLWQGAESARLQATLEQAGVTNLLLKGAALDGLAWGRIGLKQAWDIDLLVDPCDVAAAAEALTRQGYVMTAPPALDGDGWRLWVAHAKECAWTHPLSGLVVELHWRLTEAAGLLPDLTVRSPDRWVPLSATSSLAVRTLAAEGTFAYLCVHGASHGWSRLKWLADVAAILAPLDLDGRRSLHRSAVGLGAGRCPDVAFVLCERLFGLTAPPEVAGAVRRDWRARLLVWLALVAVQGGREPAERPILRDVVILSQVLFADGAGFVGAELSRQWLSLDDRLRLRLPRSLQGLYHVARLPLWVWRRMGRAGQGAGVWPMLRRER